MGEKNQKLLEKLLGSSAVAACSSFRAVAVLFQFNIGIRRAEMLECIA